MHLKQILMLALFVPVVGCLPEHDFTATRGSEPTYRERYRPQFHFTPPTNWMNDPNGMVYFDGEYHLFYQYNPFGDRWGHMSWGHAVSRDIVHWDHLEVAIPEQDDIMAFSGSAVVDWRNTSNFGSTENPPLVAVYTGRRNSDNRQWQEIAFSTDRGRTWTKYDDNPVLDIGSTEFRDPKVFWHDETARWIMVVALSMDRKISFYASEDLRSWTHLSDFGPAGAVGGVWECPDLFPLPIENRPTESRWILQVDIGDGAIAGGSGAQYFVGHFDGTQFLAEGVEIREPSTEWDNTSEDAKWVDYGPDFYAAQSWSDVPKDDGRRLWLAWMSNWQYAQDTPTSPWRSAQSIPREVRLRAYGNDLQLVQLPAAELKALRENHHSFESVEIAAGSRLLQDAGIRGTALEITADFELDSAVEFGLLLRAGENEETVVGYSVKDEHLFVDRRRSGVTGFSDQFPARYTAPLHPDNGRVKLHVFVDWSSVEVFANDGKRVITSQIFPDPESDRLEVFSRDGSVTMRSLDIWSLRSVWD